MNNLISKHSNSKFKYDDTESLTTNKALKMFLKVINQTQKKVY